MRVLFVTGTGGAGRSTVASASALRCARAGGSTLLLTSDDGALAALGAGGAAGAEPAAAAEDGLPFGAPVAVADGLWVARIDAPAHFRASLDRLQERGESVLGYLGATPLEAEEITELPGAEALALLSALAGLVSGTPGTPHAGRAPYDLVVVDLPPLPDALRLLALPEELRRYLRRLLPPERQAARALRPFLAQLAGVPAPAERLYEAAVGWDARLAAAEAVVTGPGVGVRLVLEPGDRAVRELPQALAGLALHGVALDAVVANRTLPAESADPWLAELSGAQQSALKELRDTADVTELPHLGREPGTAADLAELADALPGPGNGTGAEAPAVDNLLAAEGVLVWRLPLPGAERHDLGLVRRGDELIVTAGPYRRVLPLASALRRCTIERAGLYEGELRVRFRPDPGLWPAKD
ncbi:ArsA family ATPase [Streptomyces sp. A7024]|uniref:ArsA family ATPase n=1 Tax=Streptomyces coryli TaxID=1128680 RepID=A0A6G4U9E3_9ACTN|nr:ArsA family ATPase [Streptomyces coryli]